tara:strand:- start:18515 stop:19045 length:531 start_codon:yes stop_codon:yes gene_type:complete
MKPVFIRNPKTGSSSIAAAVPDNVSWKAHEPLKYWRAAHRTFAFVRNPWERLFSWYRHEAYFREVSFEDYVMTHAMTERYQHGNVKTWMLIADQYEWICHKEQWPTYIGRFEKLEADYLKIADLLEFEPGTLGHERINPHAREHPYTPTLWTPKMVDHMVPMFGPFAHQFGYKAPC